MIRFLSILLISATGLAAQERPSPEELLKTKLASPFLKKADWITDYDKALALAKKRKTLIFGYFTATGP